MQPGFAVCILPGVAQGLVRQGRISCQPREAVCLVADLSETAILTAPAEVAFHICHFQRRTVQVGTEPVDFPGPVLPQMVDPRQRAPDLVRVVNIGAALPALMLLLQQAVTLPEKTRFTDAVSGGDCLADAPAKRVIMVVRFEAPLRPRSARGQKAIFSVIRVVLFIQPAAPAGHVAPGIVLHKQVLPVLQAVIRDRGVKTNFMFKNG